jgi:DNA modification methylase
MSKQTNLEINDETKMDSVDSFKFEPIKGYPMLNWRGKRPFTSTQYYPAQLKENHGEAVNGWMNRIYWGDNLQVMSHLVREFRGKVDLMYIDPPFDSKADYKKKITLKGKDISSDSTTFEEKQYQDIWSNDDYLQFIYERLILMKELLSDKGLIYVHVDSKRIHHIRCILDEIFGPSKFRNQVIWHYENKLGTGGNTLDNRHDVILLYAKSSSWVHNPIRVEVKEIKKQPVTQKIDGKRIWLRDEEGKRLYQDSKTERPIGDLWTIPIINPVASERLNYPTQKPERLIEQIINLSSNPGDLVFDCFMGSGTTQTVAMRLGRRFIGADINLGAIQTTTKRLLAESKKHQGLLSQDDPIYTGFSVCNVNNYDVFRNPVQAKDLLIEALEIQPLPSNSLYDGEKDGRMVKIMPVNRISTKADLGPLITGFDYKAFLKKQEEQPNKPVESILLVCMGHEPDLAAHLKRECHGFELDVEVVDILRDKSNLEFKRDSEAEITIDKGVLKIDSFYPMNLLQKLSIQKEKIEDWRELTESIMIDWNYDGGVFEPATVDVPEKNALVEGKYKVPKDAGTIRIKITDLLSESLEMEVTHG